MRPPLTSVEAYIKRSRGSTTRAKVSGPETNPVVIKRIATRCRSLTSLEIYGGVLSHTLVEAAPALGALRHLLVTSDVGLDAVTQVLCQCSGLDTVIFRSVRAEYPAEWTGNLSRIRSLTLFANGTFLKQRSRSAPFSLLRLVSEIPF